MDIWEKFGKTASKTYQYTANKTSNLAKEMKLKSLIQEDKDKIREEYIAIGRKVYGKYRTWELNQGIDMAEIIHQDAMEGEENPSTELEAIRKKPCIMDIQEELQNECTKIDALAADAQELNLELLQLKNQKQCAHCHMHIAADSHYCSNCGYKQ